MSLPLSQTSSEPQENGSLLVDKDKHMKIRVKTRINHNIKYNAQKQQLLGVILRGNGGFTRNAHMRVYSEFWVETKHIYLKSSYRC